jgi:hypothetical protein
VARGDEAQPQVEIERPPPGRDARGNIGRVRPLDAGRTPAADPKQRRGRRQGLALMILSSIVSLLILYGAWVALRG